MSEAAGSAAPDRIVIPAGLRPADGRFGSGPTKVRAAQVEALAAAGPSLLGTSHRQAPVRNLMQRVREGVAMLLALPDDYLVVVGNGGTTAFWEVAAFGLISAKAQHLSFGEFSSKFAKVTRAAPWLAEPSVITSEPGTHPLPQAEAAIDAYALTHNETSTGVAMPIRRVTGADAGALVLVDATSAAGGIAVDPAEFDAYYFAPQKCFGSDGGLWLALLSPAAVERAAQIDASGRYIPAFLSLQTAIENSRLQQSYNTPALATLIMMAEQIDWMLEHGGMAWTTERTATSSSILYNWAEKSPVASPYVTDPAQRSPVAPTIDFADTVDAKRLSGVLRANGIVDTGGYAKLKRNQLRIGTFPAIEPSDVEALTACLDYVLERL
jgi:phosphoserine aminotransferase